MLEQAFDYLAKQGVLGLWAGLTTASTVWAVLGWMSEKEKRLQDNKDYGKLSADTAKEHFTTLDNFRKALDTAITIFSGKKD